MGILHAVVFGVVQGLTEFIPISSSAHLILVPWLLGWPEPGLAFDVALHVGTLLALLVFFARDWARLAAGAARSIVSRDVSSPEARLTLGLVLGTIPAALAGVLGEGVIERWFHGDDPVGRTRGALLIAIALALLALALFLADRWTTHERPLADLRLRDAILIGCAQALALVPGVSRSGATITAGLWLRFDRATAARFSSRSTVE